MSYRRRETHESSPAARLSKTQWLTALARSGF